MILTANCFSVVPNLTPNVGSKSRSQVLVRSLSVRDQKVVDVEKEQISYDVVGKTRKEDVLGSLEILWDDGFGTQSSKDFFKLAKEFIKPDGGPPRWFCPVSCGRPLKDSPILLYLPGNKNFVS